MATDVENYPNTPSFNFNNYNLDSDGAQNTNDTSQVAGGNIDPTRTDTVTRLEVTDDQNVRRTGHTFSSGSHATLPPPPPPNGGDDPVAIIKSNPFFKPSFLANFQAIMDDLLNLQRDTHYLEGQSELKQRALIITISETQAELTKALYDSRSQEKMIEAITSFIQAGVAAISLAQSWANAGIARANAEKRAGQSVQSEVAARDKTVSERQSLIEQRNAIENPQSVSTNPNGAGNHPMTPAEKAKALKEIDAKIIEKDKQIEKHNEKIEYYKSDEYKQGLVDTERRILDSQLSFKNEIMKNVVNGISQSLQAGLISQQGAIDALKTMGDGFLDVLRKYADSSAKSRDEAQANFDKTLDFLNKLVDSTFKAHSLGNA